MNIIFQIEGDLGINIAATAVCKAIKTQYPAYKLIVITNFPHVFFCNPYVDKKFAGHELGYFYNNYVEETGDNKYFLLNPQLSSDFINHKGHLIEVWCNLFGIKYNGEQPELFFTQREIDFLGKQFQSQKPLMVIQTNSGEPNQPKYAWMRDIPIALAQRIVNVYAKDFHVVHIRREDQLPLQNTTPVYPEFRSLAVLISKSVLRVFNDGFCQHIAAALKLPSLVFWIGNSPLQFGYSMHTNITANSPTQKPELRNSVFNRYNSIGNPTEFPYHNEEEIFDNSKLDAIFNNYIANQFKQLQKNQANAQIAERILAERNNGSKVANRLVYLIGKTDFTEVKQVGCIL